MDNKKQIKHIKHIKHMKNEGIGYTVFMVLNYLCMLILILITLLPYLNIFAKALNEGNDSLRGGIIIWPRVLSWDNFRVLLNDADMYQASLISIARVVIVVTLSLLVQFMAAYTLSRKNLCGMKFINVFFLIPMFISSGLIPQYILYSKLHLLNTFWVYIFPALFSFYNVMIIRSYISSSITDEVIEAARIEGCGEFNLLLKIIMPLSKPILATIALWVAVNAWNDWSTTLYYIQKSSLYTLQYKLMQTIKETERITSLIAAAIEHGEDASKIASSVKVTTESVQSAQVIIVTLPIICVYPFLQKYFVKGVMLGSVKG